MKLSFLYIHTPTGLYITKDSVDNSDWSYGLYISNLLFDGRLPTKSWQQEWVRIDKVPVKVQKQDEEQLKIIGYELGDSYKSLASDKLKDSIKVFEYEDLDDKVQQFYQRITEKIPAKLTDVDFQFKHLCDVDDFNNLIPNNNIRVEHQLIDKIVFHPILLPIKKAKVSRTDAFNYIKKQVEAQVNRKYCSMSTYSWEIGISKTIFLEAPESYQYDVGKRKHKYETRYKYTRSSPMITIYIDESHMKQYKDKAYATVCPEFEGDTEQDVQNKMDEYVREIIEFTNKPVQDCPHCHGLGYVLSKQEIANILKEKI